jgi:hypothetical protein
MRVDFWQEVTLALNKEGKVGRRSGWRSVTRQAEAANVGLREEAANPTYTLYVLMNHSGQPASKLKEEKSNG